MINTPPIGQIQAARYNRRAGYGIDYDLAMWHTFTYQQRNDIWDNIHEV